MYQSIVESSGGVEALRNVSAYHEPAWHFEMFIMFISIHMNTPPLVVCITPESAESSNFSSCIVFADVFPEMTEAREVLFFLG